MKHHSCWIELMVEKNGTLHHTHLALKNDVFVVGGGEGGRVLYFKIKTKDKSSTKTIIIGDLFRSYVLYHLCLRFQILWIPTYKVSKIWLVKRFLFFCDKMFVLESFSISCADTCILIHISIKINLILTAPYFHKIPIVFP